MGNFNFGCFSAIVMIIIWGAVIYLAIKNRKEITLDSFIIIILVSVLFECSFIMSVITSYHRFELYPLIIPAYIFTAYIFVTYIKRQKQWNKVKSSEAKLKELEHNLMRMSEIIDAEQKNNNVKSK